MSYENLDRLNIVFGTTNKSFTFIALYKFYIFTRQMKILHVIDDLRLGGGAEFIALHTANSLPGKNFIFYFKHDKYFRQSDFPAITFIRSPKSFTNILSTIELRAAIKKHKIDIVHSHLFWGNLIARIATPSNVKLFTHIHNIQSLSSLQSRKSRVFERLIYNKRETTLCVSNEVAEDYRTIVSNANVATLYNFIDDKYFLNNHINRGKSKFITVGTIKPQKNYGLLLDVFTELKNIGRADISLDIYGYGDFSEIEQRSKDINVNYCGLSSELEKVYSEHDALIMASLYEGYGLVVIEAMASGLPVILSDIPVFREISGNNAVFFNPYSVKDCVNKIVSFCDGADVPYNYEWAQRIGKKSSYINKLLSYYGS